MNTTSNTHVRSKIWMLGALAAATLLAPRLDAAPQSTISTMLPGDTAIAPPAGDQTEVEFARGNGSTLMVWEDSRAALAGTQDGQGHDFGSQLTDVYAQRLDDAGVPIDPSPILVATAAFAQEVPKVAWNGQNWLVVWTTRTPSPFTTTQGVYGARISPAGQVLDDPAIVISDSQSFDEREIVVASDGNQWAVAWKAGIASGTDAVRGSLVSAAGVPDAPRNFFQTVNGVGYYLPWNFELEFAGGRYLLVSQHMHPSASYDDIFGQLFDTGLNKVGGEFQISTNSWNQIKPGLASNGTGFYVTWLDEQQWGEVRGSPVSAAGVVAKPDGVVFQTAMYGTDPHPEAGWDGTNWVVAWDDGFIIRAARASVAGNVLAGSPIQVTAGVQTMRPDVASLPGKTLVGWVDFRNLSSFGSDSMDLYGSVLDAAGNLAPATSLLNTPPAQTRPKAAGDAANGFLVTYLSETAGTAQVLAQRVSASGAPIDPQPLVLRSGGRDIKNPAVGWDGTQWLVAWEELNAAWPPGSGNVFARRVSAAGVALDPTPIQVQPGNEPEVAAIAGTFLVVATVEPINHIRYVRGVRVRSSDGALLDASPIQIGSSYAVRPAVDAFSDRWLVAWQGHPTHDKPTSRIFGNIVLADGTPQAQFVIADTPAYNRNPSVAVADDVALVAWDDGLNTGSNVHAGRVLADGTRVDSSAGFPVSSAPNDQFAPAAGWDGTKWFVAWNDYRAHTNILDGGVGDLYGTRVDATGVVLDPAGQPLAVNFDVPEGNPWVVGAAGRSLTFLASVHPEAPFGTFRIDVLGTCDAPVSYCTAKVNSLGCTPSIGATGAPSASAASGFVVRGTNVRNNKNGLLLYGVNGRASTPFQGGTLCVASPIRRTPGVGSGGTPPPANDCTGVYAIDMNAFAQGLLGGNPLPALRVAGTVVDCQWWGRDPGFPAPASTTLTNGLEYGVCP